MTYILPIVILLILIPAIKGKIPIYSVFCTGVENGLKTVVSIFPVLLAICVGVSMLKTSGLMDLICFILSPITDFLKIPQEVLPLALIRPISGSGAISVLSDILENFHPDSKIGIIASVIMGSTETTFYTLMVYFKKTRVKYSTYIIPAAVFGDIVGVLAGVWASAIIF